MVNINLSDTDKASPARLKTVKPSEASRTVCLIPEDGLPPVILSTGVKGDYSIEENPQAEKILPQIKDGMCCIVLVKFPFKN